MREKVREREGNINRVIKYKECIISVEYDTKGTR